MKQLKRLYFLFRILTVNELLYVLYHHFITQTLPEKNRQLHRILIFILACVDKNYGLELCENNVILVKNIGKNKKKAIGVRKYSRDLLVFEGFFIFDDYLPYIEQIKKKLNVQFIIDAGANIGCASLYLLEHFPKAKIVCIEPESSNYELLLKNMHINFLEKNTVCIRKALWNKNQELELRKIEEFPDDGYHVMQEGKTDKVIDKVLTCTLDDILAETKQVCIDLLKIDIEGAEKVIFHDKEHINQFLPKTKVIIMEVHPKFIDVQEIENILKTYNFNVISTEIGGQPIAIIAFNKNYFQNDF
jgi:FkbM family methyltransferase